MIKEEQLPTSSVYRPEQSLRIADCDPMASWLLISSYRHLQRVLTTYVDHYNCHRPHRGIGLTIPDRLNSSNRSRSGSGPAARLHVRRRDRLGGLLHEYELSA
jgi:putative transposase